MRRLGRFATATIAACALAVATAGAVGTAREPYAVAGASVVQQAQQLVWSVSLDHAFSPSTLNRSGRTLCLVIAPIAGHGAAHVACVQPGHHPGQPELVWTHGRQPGVVVPASISQPTPNGLTASFSPAALGLAYRRVRWQVVGALNSPACAEARHECRTVFPARPADAELHTPKLVGCAARGPSLVYAGPTKGRDVALTFDDGPWDTPPPSAFLNVLEHDHATATFFEIGEHISTYDPDGAFERRMLADGDMIGDHSWSHPDVAALPLRQQRYQLLQTIHAIKKATGGFTPCLWRPPYGHISPRLVSLARSLGLLTVMWDVDPRDWALPGVSAIYENVVSHAHDGAIVIQHFGGGPRYQTVAALPREIDMLHRRGYRLVTVAQMLGLRLIYK